MAKAMDVNKIYGRTIGIKHYLDKRVRPKIVGTEKAIAYPLYVRVTAKKQTTTFKSALNEYIPEENFDSFLIENRIQLEKEANLLRNKILEAKPFEREDFNISLALQSKHSNNFDLAKRVEDLLQEQVKEILAKSITGPLLQYQTEFELHNFFIPSEHPMEYKFNLTGQAYINARKQYNWNGTTAFYHISTLASIAGENSEFAELLNKYPISFWNFSRYCALIASFWNEPFFTLEDWHNGKIGSLLTQALKQIRQTASFPTVFSTLDAKLLIEDFRIGLEQLELI